jgi:hypothetical protein
VPGLDGDGYALSGIGVITTVGSGSPLPSGGVVVPGVGVVPVVQALSPARIKLLARMSRSLIMLYSLIHV